MANDHSGWERSDRRGRSDNRGSVSGSSSIEQLSAWFATNKYKTVLTDDMLQLLHLSRPQPFLYPTRLSPQLLYTGLRPPHSTTPSRITLPHSPVPRRRGLRACPTRGCTGNPGCGQPPPLSPRERSPVAWCTRPQRRRIRRLLRLEHCQTQTGSE